MKIVLTGGTGLLGSEIRRIDSSLTAPAHEEMDITDLASIRSFLDSTSSDTILHLAAATKPPEHESAPQIGVSNNIIGTANLALVAIERSMRFVYTSTDYVYSGPGPHREDEPLFAPSNFVRSKLGGEYAAQMVPKHLILRLSFGPVPFPWDKVYRDQYNSKLYVDEMAPLVLALARTEETGIINVGGPRISLEAYAQRTKPDITTIPKPDWVPEDTSLDIARMKNILGITDERSLLKR